MLKIEIESQEQPEAAPVEVQAPAAEAASPPQTRTPDGMTRETYYVAKADAEALDAAVETLHRDLGGLVPKHRILGAIFRRGVSDVGQIRAELRAELITGLVGGE